MAEKAPPPIQAKSGFFQGMEITISKTAAFHPEDSWVIYNGWRPDPYPPPIIRGFHAFIDINQADYAVLKSDDLDNEGSSTTTFTIRIALLGRDTKFKVQASGLGLQLPDQRGKWEKIFIMSIHRAEIENEGRYIQIKIPDYKKADPVSRLNKDEIVRILTERANKDPTFSPSAYCGTEHVGRVC